MTRRLRASPATREAVHQDPRPKEYCPRHGTSYPAKGCEQCAYEKEHPIKGPFAGQPCRVVLEGRIHTVEENTVEVDFPDLSCPVPGGTVALRVPKKAVTPLVEVKS